MLSMSISDRVADATGAQVTAVLAILLALTLAPRPALLTAAILTVPFAIWWCHDRGQRRACEAAARAAALAAERRDAPAPVDYDAEAVRAEQLGMPDQAAF